MAQDLSRTGVQVKKKYYDGIQLKLRTKQIIFYNIGDVIGKVQSLTVVAGEIFFLVPIF